jgi:hypothetical protein
MSKGKRRSGFATESSGIPSTIISWKVVQGLSIEGAEEEYWRRHWDIGIIGFS